MEACVREEAGELSEKLSVDGCEKARYLSVALLVGGLSFLGVMLVV